MADIIEQSDAVFGIQTTERFAVGQTFSGAISASGDRDWIAVDLTAGERYNFTLYSNIGIGGLADPFLRLLSADGALILSNDDIEDSNFFSALSYEATHSGTYYLEVLGSSKASFSKRIGAYTLRSATDFYTVDQVASQLTDMAWGASTGLVRFAAPTITFDTSQMSLEARTLIFWATDMWSKFTGITFVETNLPGAGITFERVDPSQGAGEYAFTRLDRYSAVTGELSAATVYVSDAWLQKYGTDFASYSYFTFLHELGHALGLGHGGFYDESATYPKDAFYTNDSWQMSAMSYFDTRENKTLGASDFLPLTPMIADIAAMARLYGQPKPVYADDTVWGANSNVGGALSSAFRVRFDNEPAPAWIDTGRNFGFTVNDRGGRDRLDFSKTSAAQKIDLRTGGISDVYGLKGTVLIAQGADIEDARGGAGCDTIIGNGLGNLLMGGAGNDDLSGDDGDDQLWGGVDNDSLSGGNGEDRLGGSSGNDTLSGGAGDDQLWGGAGSDLMRGDGGRDTLWGGGGNDNLQGGAEDDHLGGGAGNDFLTGNAGADTFIFFRQSGGDTIADFTPQEGDRLIFARWLWSGVLVEEQIVENFARMDGDGVYFDFGGAETQVILRGYFDIAGVSQYITIWDEALA